MGTSEGATHRHRRFTSISPCGLGSSIGTSQVYEIGGPDQASYGQIMKEYARQRGLKRWMIPVPLLTPYLSSLWLGLVTPLYASRSEASR